MVAGRIATALPSGRRGGVIATRPETAASLHGRVSTGMTFPRLLLKRSQTTVECDIAVPGSLPVPMSPVVPVSAGLLVQRMMEA